MNAISAPNGIAPGARVAGIGSGIAGLSAAWLLQQAHAVTLFEQAPRAGGHAETQEVLVGNRLVRWFPSLHVRLAVVFRMIERHDQKLILGFQFVPGLCTVTPVVASV